VSPDHLDRHRDFDEYLRAKLRIFANQGNDDAAIFNASEAVLRGLDLGGCGRRIAYCRGVDPDCEVAVADGVIFAGADPLLRVEELRLLGPHNVDNAMAGTAAALAMGLDRDSIRDGLRTFRGVAHRLERVGERDGVLYVNDSKATNVAAAAAALRSFEGGVLAILGGSLKGGDFQGLLDPVVERCRACYLIGDAAEQLATELRSAEGQGVELRRCVGLRDAVNAAAADAQPGEVVLLSPACASFDAYRDFEERGEHFRALVEELQAR
jgi:UDP-N-acetylmuramoylalanine--D-glutamate ligase